MKLLTLTETSELTRRTVKSLRQMMHRGTFPSTKIGGRIFVAEEELQKFLKLSRTTTAEAAAGKEAEA
jgi:DNA-binding FadR family transcriptional regulator